MLRHLAIRSALAIAALVLTLAGCGLAWIAFQSAEPEPTVRIRYRFDPAGLGDREGALRSAARTLEHRLRAAGARRVGSRCTGSTDVELEAALPFDPSDDSAAIVGPFELDADIRRTLETPGDLRFLPRAEAEDLARMGLDLEQEERALRTWRLDHTAEPIEEFLTLPAEAGGPSAGLAWYPMRGATESPELGAQAIPFRLPDARWTFRSEDLESVGPSPGPAGYPAVHFEIAASRRQDFESFTESLVGKELGIVYSGEVLALPTVQERLPGAGIIEGGARGFTPEEVRSIVGTLRAGRLPGRPVLVEATRGPVERDDVWTIYALLAATAFVTAAGMLLFAIFGFRKPA